MDYKFLADVALLQNKASATAAALGKRLTIHSVVSPQGIIVINRPSFYGLRSVH
jgi:hypothetical protein